MLQVISSFTPVNYVFFTWKTRNFVFKSPDYPEPLYQRVFSKSFTVTYTAKNVEFSDSVTLTSAAKNIEFSDADMR